MSTETANENLTPSYRLWPVLALTALVLLVCLTRYADYDLWWHLKLGESVLQGGIPWQDTFSYTAAGRGQFTGEWLADLLIYLTFRGGGFLGLNLLKAGLLGLALYYCWLRIRPADRESRDAFGAAIVTLLVVLFAVRFRLFVRPYLFSLPLLAATLYLLERWLAGQRDRLVWLLPLLVLLWANLSVGVVFGVFAVGLAAVVDGAKNRSWRLLPLLLAVLAASLANPETWRLYTLAIDLTSDPYRTLIGEYQPITREILFGSGRRYTLCFQLLAGGGLVWFLLRRGWRDPFQLVLFAFLLFESFRQVRLVELFSLVAALPFARLLVWLAGLLPERLKARAGIGHLLLAGLIVALIPGAVFRSPVYTFGNGPKANAFPDGALAFLDRERISGRMFNSYGFGGYVIWAGGGRKVFIDGRYRRLYTPAEYGEYKAAMESAEAWRATEAKHGFDYALLEYDLLSRRFPAHLPDNRDWALVYWDNCSLVYVRRTPERAALIAAREYRTARPAFLDFSYLDAYGKQGRVNEALAALDREVALNPDNQFVLLARIYLRYQLGKLYLPQIRADLERLLVLKPDFAMKHSAYAMVLVASGEKEEAARQVRAALRLDPLDQAAHALAGQLGIKVTIPKGAIPGHP